MPNVAAKSLPESDHGPIEGLIASMSMWTSKGVQSIRVVSRILYDFLKARNRIYDKQARIRDHLKCIHSPSSVMRSKSPAGSGLFDVRKGMGIIFLRAIEHGQVAMYPNFYCPEAAHARGFVGI